ncbi:hypothetical protein T10_159, partial [Trichinella papuae]
LANHLRKMQLKSNQIDNLSKNPMAPVDLFYKQTRFMKGKQPQRSNGQQQASLCSDLILVLKLLNESNNC